MSVTTGKGKGVVGSTLKGEATGQGGETDIVTDFRNFVSNTFYSFSSGLHFFRNFKAVSFDFKVLVSRDEKRTVRRNLVQEVYVHTLFCCVTINFIAFV